MERRFWYGLGILILLLGVGLWTARSLEKLHTPVKDSLEQAARAVMDGDMEKGVALAGQARTVWQQRRMLTTAVADHGPVEEIDSLFSQIQVYAQTGSTTDFAAYCARLAKLVAAVGEAHSLSWQNLL